MSTIARGATNFAVNADREEAVAVRVALVETITAVLTVGMIVLAAEKNGRSGKFTKPISLVLFNVVLCPKKTVTELVQTTEIIVEVGPAVEIVFRPIEVVQQRECARSGAKMGALGSEVRNENAYLIYMYSVICIHYPL